MKNAGFWGLIIVIIVVALGGLFLLAGSGNDPQGDGTLVGEVTENDHVKGSLDAPVVLVEYGDLECAACAAFHPILKEFEEFYGDDLAVVFRHYPLRSIHPKAQISAQAAQAAGMQGKFFEMHDILYERQSDWGNRRDISVPDAQDIMFGYAEELGLDMEQFEEDFNSDVVRDAIADDVETAQQAGLTGTPSIFVNGRFFQPQTSYQELGILIDSILDPATDAPIEASDVQIELEPVIQ